MLARISKSIQSASVPLLRQYPTQLAAFTQSKSFCSKGNENTTTESTNQKDEPATKLGSFAKAFKEIEQLVEKPKEKTVENVPFKKMLRESSLIDLGDPLNKIVSGKIVHTVGNDLYIDFGWKFNCVCVRPEKNADLYVRGAMVKLKIKELELSTLFLGQEKDLTILEADCVLLGLLSSPKSQNRSFSASAKK